MKLNSFFKQCHEKEVFKMLSIYVVSSWVILQVLSIIWQPLGLPQKSVTFLIIVLLICFPLYMFFLWKWHLLPIEKKQIELNKEVKHKKSGFKRMYFSALTIIGSVSAIAVFLIAEKNFSKTSDLPTKIMSDRIAVLKFGNNTGNPKYDIVGKMASDWIIHGITENKVAQVITQEVINDYSTILKGRNIEEEEGTIVKEYLKPSMIITGNFYLKGKKLLFQAMLIDGKTDETLISFEPTECASGNPIECIDNLSQSITGYFVTEGKHREMLQESPPKYEAYKDVVEAKHTSDSQQYISLLDRAIATDSNYFEPKVLRVAYYYNVGNYMKADSLRKMIKPDSYSNKRQLNLLNMYQALLQGNNRTVYRTMMNEYRIAPFDLKSNMSAMVASLQFVNLPQKVDTIFKAVKMDSISLPNCSDCLYRIYVKALADIELGRYKTAIKNILKAQENGNMEILQKPLIAAYIRSGNNDALVSFMGRAEITASPEDLQLLYLFIGKEYLLRNDRKKADDSFGKIINIPPADRKLEIFAKALFYSRDYAQAEKALEEVHHKNPKNSEVLSKLAITNHSLENKTSEEKNVLALERLYGKYQYGTANYALAQYYAAIGDKEELYRHLLKSVASGQRYTSETFKNDPLFLDYSRSKNFEDVMNFWK